MDALTSKDLTFEIIYPIGATAMKTFKPNQKITIEITSDDASQSKGYAVWHVKKKGDPSRRISSWMGATDAEIESILNSRQLDQFEEGKGRFTVTAQSLADVFQYIP